MKLIENENVRAFLRKEFLSRCRKNPNYSMRAFALHLGLDPSTFVKMVNGKRPIGRKALFKIMGKLNVQVEDEGQFFKSSESESEAYASISRDTFAAISQWWHFAILEYLVLPNVSRDPKSIGEAFGLETKVVEDAIERLANLRLVRYGEDGWEDATGGKTGAFPGGKAEETYKMLQRDLLKKALDAIDDVPMHERDHTSIMMAIDASKIEDAKVLIRNFRRNLAKTLRAGGQYTDVYNLSVCLFPLGRVKDQPCEQ